TAQARRKLRPDRPHQSHYAPQRSPREGRGADRSVLRKSQSSQLCRFAEYYRAASGNVARVGGASGKGSAEAGDGGTEVAAPRGLLRFWGSLGLDIQPA